MIENALRYGLYLPPFGPFGDPAVLVDLAVRAEASGWDGVFLWDHLVSGVKLGEGVPDPHPIPVWVASTAGHPRVIRRAAACDGIFPIRGNRTPAPDEVAGLLAALRRAGLPESRAFDIAVAGNASPAWQEPVTADLAGLAQAGMTWWMESLIHFDPIELSREIVGAGPPRG